jgi:hypothetical protein
MFQEVESFSWVNQNDVKWPEVETTAVLKWDSLQLIFISYLIWYVVKEVYY